MICAKIIADVGTTIKNLFYGFHVHYFESFINDMSVSEPSYFRRNQKKSQRQKFNM